MNINDLKPAREFAMQFGVKAVIYGPPGSAKTPTINTCPNPVLLATEPGLLSMRNSNVPTWIAPTKKLIDEFFKWFEHSNESKKFDTLAVDSVSQVCDIALRESTSKHGLAQYGDMAEYVEPYLDRMYFLQNKHMFFIAKEEITSAGIRRPYFPGKYLPTQIPHKYDCILRLSKVNLPNIGETLAFQCNGSYDVVARNRTGTLDTFEPPDFNALIRKCMQ